MTDPGSARVEAVLRRAAADPEFRADLLARRSAAAADAGFPLTGAERALLDSVPVAQLEATLATLPPEAPAPVATSWDEATTGIRPDLPPGVAFASQGIRPDAPPEPLPVVRGIRPDDVPPHFDKVKGIRPVLPVALAAGAVLAGGAVIATMCTHGVRPDVPAATTPPAAPTGTADAGAAADSAAAPNSGPDAPTRR